MTDHRTLDLDRWGAGKLGTTMPTPETKDQILADMDREIEAAVIRARRRLAALESEREQSPEPHAASAPTRED